MRQRVEIEPWRGHNGPLPLIAIRVRTDTGWPTFEATAGTVSRASLAIGRANDREPILIDVPIDPAVLIA